ncbi:tRNA wybutosine-synthesizing protein 2/3/4-like [Hibiscus syriacus]|uniref:tRNA wybutosine-synthesizing protein 2/3/4-like n=1 Tax=Hibiscus syriacus TaxID=106335 RepID=UPI0019218B97|nr:tRNA wybutosine-synthesizing protein 2/3/4-like [Hibiscus syriacus]
MVRSREKSVCTRGWFIYLFPRDRSFVLYSLKTNLNGRVTIILSKHLKLKVLLNEMSSSAALDILKEFGAIKLPDEVVQRRKASKSPLKIMTEADASLIRQNGLSDELLEQLPNRWERLGDIIVFPISSFRDPVWDSIGGSFGPLLPNPLILPPCKAGSSCCKWYEGQYFGDTCRR